MSHIEMPLEIKEIIAHYVEDIENRHNLFEACPDLRPAIKKQPVVVELNLHFKNFL